MGANVTEKDNMKKHSDLSKPVKQPVWKVFGNDNNDYVPQSDYNHEVTNMSLTRNIRTEELLKALKEQMPMFEELLIEVQRGYEDGIYRYYHGSVKVFGLQNHTEAIVTALQSLRPDQPLNKQFMSIVHEGTRKIFTRDDNLRWKEATSPIVEAYFHALYFLEVAVKYSKLIELPNEAPFPSGWAALLYLYNLR